MSAHLRNKTLKQTGAIQYWCNFFNILYKGVCDQYKVIYENFVKSGKCAFVAVLIRGISVYLKIKPPVQNTRANISPKHQGKDPWHHDLGTCVL